MGFRFFADCDAQEPLFCPAPPQAASPEKQNEASADDPT
jgi:hypothetical protein